MSNLVLAPRRYLIFLVALMMPFGLSVPVSTAHAAISTQGIPEINWTGLHSVHGVVTKDDVAKDQTLPLAYVFPGQTIVAESAVGTENPNDYTGKYHWVVDCHNAQSQEVKRISPSRSIKVPGEPNLPPHVPWPEVYPVASLKIPDVCAPAKNPSPQNTNAFIFFCITTDHECSDVPLEIVAPGTTLPGSPIPHSGKIKLYTWVNGSELKYINAHGTFRLNRYRMGEFFYQTYSDAQEFKTLFKGYKLIRAVITGSNVEVDYSVAVAGYDTGGLFIVNEGVLGLFTDLVVVAG